MTQVRDGDLSVSRESLIMGTMNSTLRDEWTLPEDVIYLNHGSFGPSPRVVQQARLEWSTRIESQPMDFYLRRMVGCLDEATGRLAEFIGADAKDLVFVDNATTGMNAVAASLELGPGDEILTTDHEYGAVLRVWRFAAERCGANVIVHSLPRPLMSADEIVESLMSRVTDRTRLLVVSHVTSATAVILPVESICRRAQVRGVPVCVDGPHALAMLPLDLRRLGCDFYTASCHKWLSAPFGSGFLYVAPRHQRKLVPAVRSWGTSLSGLPSDWKDEFLWVGTRDLAPYLAVPTAIDFVKSHGLDAFRRHSHVLAQFARTEISRLTGQQPLVPDSSDWYGSMISLPLPTSASAPQPVLRDPLQEALWHRYRIEAPVFVWQGQRLLRISCHLYNSQSDIEKLVAALRELI